MRVKVQIGADGTVLSAKGSSAEPLLAVAAEENARLWVFDPPRGGHFPLEHTITYVFRLVGEPSQTSTVFFVQPHLPDSIEVEARPAFPDVVKTIR